jgi:hypothetical protein
MSSSRSILGVAGFIGLDPMEATKRLHERWAKITRPSLIGLRATLLEFEVRAVVEFRDGGLIYAERPNSDIDMIGNSFYIPAPIDANVLDTRLKSVSLSGNVAVRDFMMHFAGLAETTFLGGNVVYLDSPWPTFTDSLGFTVEGFDEWKGAPVVFAATNGCDLLVHPTGKVALWVMQEHLIGDVASTFDEFVLQFNEHRKLAWPFDPYGPPD